MSSGYVGEHGSLLMPFLKGSNGVIQASMFDHITVLSFAIVCAHGIFVKQMFNQDHDIYIYIYDCIYV